MVLSCTRDWKNPYDDANYNTPPTARVRLSHAAGTVDTLFIADASESYDAEDSLTDLQFRWDWESDGTWDDDWSSATVDSHRFTDGGVKAVKLAVQDRGGMADTVVVTLGINAAPVARFRMTPRLDNFEYSVTVDAGTSTDLEDDSTTLEYRWDFGNGDGWSVWSAAETLAYAYVIADKNSVHQRTVRLEVRDSGGAVGTVDTSITVDFHPGMKLITGGPFMMGSDFEDDSLRNPYAGQGLFAAEQPVHDVTVSGFWMDTVEVTQADFENLMGYNPSGFRGFDTRTVPVDRVGWFDGMLYCNARSKRDGLDTVYSYDLRTEYSVAGVPGTYVRYDVVTIDYDATGYRLPTEAEWEYASRGGSDSLYCYGNDPAAIDAYAWHYDNSGQYTRAVAQKLPNAYGLYDMYGNVAEWCNDWYGPYTAASADNPRGASKPLMPADQMKIQRGGYYESAGFIVRSAFRQPELPFITSALQKDAGFRVVLPVE